MAKNSAIAESQRNYSLIRTFLDVTHINTMIHYAYTHTQTEATTGFFSCEPEPAPSFADAIAYVIEHPYDDFMRKHVLSQLGAMTDDNRIAALQHLAIQQSLPESLIALFCEMRTLFPDLAPLFPPVDSAISQSITNATSLPLLRWHAQPDAMLHEAWGKKFAANIHRHIALQAPDSINLPPLYTTPPSWWQSKKESTTLPQLHATYANTHASEPAYIRPPSDETAALAAKRLHAAGIIAGEEMRHTASLSPVALLRPWNVSLTVDSGRHTYSLQGTATTYGRGLSIADARASCLMEMVERASMYVSVKETHVTNRLHAMHLVQSSYSALVSSGKDAVNPHDFPLDVPYNDNPLYWAQGTSSDGQPVYIPLQMAALFCNLDEISLSDSLGSTGIATGTTIEEAKLAALLEIFERNAEATTPFTKASCFTITTDDARIDALLRDYAARGIHVQFQDLTGPLGIPVYQCFVMNRKGIIARGYGAGLSGRRALLSAMTETPYPYPHGEPSGPLLRKLPMRTLEDLPDYTLPTPAQNLAMLETLLCANGTKPVYLDFTRNDLLFPVVRAFIPHMALAADFDSGTRIPYPLYANYLHLFESS